MTLPLSSWLSQINQLKIRLGSAVVLGDGAPEDVFCIANVGPALDAGEQAFDPRAIAADAVGLAVHCPRIEIFLYPVVVGILHKEGNDVLGAREDENVGIDNIEILR